MSCVHGCARVTYELVGLKLSYYYYYIEFNNTIKLSTGEEKMPGVPINELSRLIGN